MQKIDFDGFSVKIEASGIDWLVTTITNTDFANKPTPVRVKPGETYVIGQGESRHVICNPAFSRNIPKRFGVSRFCGGCNANNKEHVRCVVR